MGIPLKYTTDTDSLLFHSSIYSEEDPYELCAGNAVHKCFKEDEIRFEHHLKDYNKNNAGYREYVKCFEDEAVTCDKPILQHFITILFAFQRHVVDKVKLLKPKL